MLWLRLFFVVPMISVSALCYAQEPSAATPPKENNSNVNSFSPVTGSLITRYRFRTIGKEDDHDLDTILSIETPLSEGNPWYVAAEGAGHFDLNSTSANSVYRDTFDAFGHDSVGRLYYAYVERREVGPLQNIRLGRQQRYEFEFLSYDGVTLETKRVHGVSAVVYGGTPVHFYESQTGFNTGDYLAGSALQFDPAPNFRGRADYVHIKDELSTVFSPFGDQKDDLLAGSVWWDATESVNLSSRFSSFTDQVRDVSGSLTMKSIENDWQLRLDFFRLLQESEVRVTDLDAYSIVGTYKRYNEFSAKVSKGFLGHLTADIGTQVRILDHFQSAGAFNHGYERTYLSLSTNDLLVNGLSMNAVGDYYHGEDNTLKNNTFGGSFFVTQDLKDRKYRIHGGTAYFLYKYNLFAGNESQDVQTYFAQVDFRIVKALEARVGYELEHNSIDTFHQMETRMIWRF